MVRLLRVLRLAKVARHSEVISIVLESLVESATGVVVLMSFVSMWALVCATVVYAAEIDAPDTDFVSIPAALWWSMATISTVGYGDMVPHTSLGKLVGGVSMLGGILITSISVAVITTSFTEHYQQRVRVHEVSKFKELARRHSMLENANANGEVTPDSSTVTRSRQPDVLASWQELEEEVQKHLVRLEAEILYRPLRTRPSDTHVALEMLKDDVGSPGEQQRSLCTADDGHVGHCAVNHQCCFRNGSLSPSGVCKFFLGFGVCLHNALHSGGAMQNGRL